MRFYASVSVALAAALVPMAAHAKLTTDDVIKMAKAGLPEAVVIATVKASGARFDLSASDIINLHKAGVPPKVIEAMVETSKTAAAGAKKDEKKAVGEVAPRREPRPDRGKDDRWAEEDERRAAERRRRAEEARAEEERRSREEAAERKRSEERRRALEEERRAEERRREDRRDDDRRRDARDDRRDDRRRDTDDDRRPDDRRAEERRRKEDDDRRAEERRRKEDDERRAEERRRKEDDDRRAEERRRKEDDDRRAEERRRKEDDDRRAEERRKEDERRAEERRRDEERKQRRRADEQRLSEKMSVFATGKDLESGGHYLNAAGYYHEYYTQLAAPGTQEYFDAEYYLARALHQGGLGQAAIQYLSNVVRRGPRDPNFTRAFRRLRVVSEQLLVTNPELMDRLSETLVDQLPDRFRDELNYALGKFYHRWGNHTKASRFLDLVSERSPFFASAAYLRGLILLREKKAKSAHELFKKAVLAAEKSPGRKEADQGVLELGYLALARLAYEVGGHKAAIFYYDKVPHSSTKLGQALFEKGWVHFQSGNYPLALGTFHGLHSAYFADRFHPDLYILEATIYLNMCHFSLAKELVEAYQKVYGKIHKDLKALLAKGTTPQQLFDMFLATGAGRSEGALPVQLYSYVLQDAEFADLVAALKDYDKQARLLKRQLRNEAKGEKLWRLSVAEVDARREQIARSAGSMIRQKLQKAEQELGEFLIKADEITFETINAEKEQLDKEAAALMTGKTLAEGKLKEAEKITVPWTHEYWEYDGEVWADEVDAYRSLLQDGCKQ